MVEFIEMRCYFDQYLCMPYSVSYRSTLEDVIWVMLGYAYISFVIQSLDGAISSESNTRVLF